MGRGLESLIPKTAKENEGFLEIEIRKIAPNPYQPRKAFDQEKLEELADSFRENGIIQPVILRPAGEGYQLVAGERRFQAAKIAGMDKVPAIIKDVPDIKMLEISLIENIQRDDLNPLEEAESYRRLMDEFGLRQEDVAGVIGKSRTSVANTIRLLNLNEEVKSEIVKGRLSRGHALALLSLESRLEQAKLGRKIVSEGLSVRETELLIKRGLRYKGRSKQKQSKPPELVTIEEKLQLVFGTRVNVKQFKTGGKIEIEYYTNDDFERILNALNITLD